MVCGTSPQLSWKPLGAGHWGFGEVLAGQQRALCRPHVDVNAEATYPRYTVSQYIYVYIYKRGIEWNFTGIHGIWCDTQIIIYLRANAPCRRPLEKNVKKRRTSWPRTASNIATSAWDSPCAWKASGGETWALGGGADPARFPDMIREDCLLRPSLTNHQ